MHNSPFTHTILHIMNRVLYPGLKKLRIRRDCVIMSKGCTSFFSLREPQLESVHFICMSISSCLPTIVGNAVK